MCLQYFPLWWGTLTSTWLYKLSIRSKCQHRSQVVLVATWAGTCPLRLTILTSQRLSWTQRWSTSKNQTSLICADSELWYLLYLQNLLILSAWLYLVFFPHQTRPETARYCTILQSIEITSCNCSRWHLHMVSLRMGTLHISCIRRLARAAIW